MGVEQGVLDQQLLLVVQEEHGLAEEDTSDPVGNRGVLVELEIHDVFVSAGLIVVLAITVNAEIEFPAMLDKCLIQRG